MNTPNNIDRVHIIPLECGSGFLPIPDHVLEELDLHIYDEVDILVEDGVIRVVPVRRER